MKIIIKEEKKYYLNKRERRLDKRCLLYKNDGVKYKK